MVDYYKEACRALENPDTASLLGRIQKDWKKLVYVFVVDGLPLIITWAIIIFFYLVFASSFSFCNPFSCHSQFDFIKYSFAHVSDHGPCCLLDNDSVQAVMVIN